MLLTASCRAGSTDQRDSPPDPANGLPFGIVESPHSGETVGRVVDVMGWAVDDSAVRIVHIYVDGTYQASAHLTIGRADVAKQYPRYGSPGDIHGWHTLADLGEKPGVHEIIVQAVDDRGATRDIGAFVVNLIDR